MERCARQGTIAWASALLGVGAFPLFVALALSACAASHSIEDAGAEDASPDTGDALPRFERVSVQGWNSCALRNDGAAICWGEVFPDGPVVRTGPVQKVVAGPTHACFLQDGAIDCISPAYADLHPPIGALLDVPPGEYLDFDSSTRTCGLRTDQEVVCWGAAGVTPPPADRPDFVRLLTHEGRVCGIDSEGAPTCWLSTIGDDNILVPSVPLLDFSLGQFHACGVRLDGEIECFIADYAADWDDEDLIRPYPEGPFSRIMLVPTHMACALRPDGELVCWGRVYESRLRNSEPKGLRYKDVSLSSGHVCAVTLEGELVCWGSNDFGEATPPTVDF